MAVPSIHDIWLIYTSTPSDEAGSPIVDYCNQAVKSAFFAGMVAAAEVLSQPVSPAPGDALDKWLQEGDEWADKQE